VRRVLVSGVVGLYADAVQRLWRGDADECELVLSHALQAREVRQRLKREAEVAVMGGEVAQAAWTGAKASALHKAFEKLQVAEAIAGDDVAVSTGVLKHSEEEGGGSKRGCKGQEDGGGKASEEDRRRDTSPHPLPATPASHQQSMKQAKSKRRSKKSSLPEEKKEEVAGGVGAAEDSEEA